MAVGKRAKRKTRVPGLWRHKSGYWYYTRMRQGVRKTVALETKDETEAAVKALQLVDAPELGLSGSLIHEIDAYIQWKVDNNEFSRFTAPQRKTVLVKFMHWMGDETIIGKITPMDIQDFDSPYTKYLDYIGKKHEEDFSEVTPHIMRHTFASLLANAGVSLYKISKWLGDTHKTTEKHYAHLQASDDEINLLRSAKH